MTDTFCDYANRDEVLVAFVYDEIDSAERAAFRAHLARCPRCRDQLSALASVRARLAQWSPPEPAFVANSQQTQVPSLRPPAWRGWWREVPAWAQVAAASLFLGVGAGIADLNVHYDQNGLTVRTGWAKTTSPVVNPAPWRADLASMEKQLQTEFHAAQVSPATPARPASSLADAEILRRVRALVDESERRQQRELALRLADALRDVETERRADLVKIDRSLGVLQNSTGVEVLRQRELLNYLVRVSQNK